MEEPVGPEPQRVFGERAGRRLSVALLGAIAAVVAFTWRDAGKVQEHERFAEVTAVGDLNIFELPEHGAVGQPVAQIEGKTWRIADLETNRFRDTRMVRVARDEARGLTLYRPHDAASTDELYVKIEPNRYLRLKP